MKDFYKAYLEILFIEATHKLLEVGLPVYVLVIEDAMGFP